ncbi:MAG: 2-oxo acid dehydrogenase subunit E2 [Oligoflexia bacterium]|nr:2-oxo acid dehydrogenase subunit E2 [Oligoflexia bacterium]
MGRLHLEPLRNPPVTRKLTLGTWRNAYEASVYAQMDLDMTKALDFLKRFNEENNVKATPVHLVGMAIKRCMQERPEINGMIRHGKIYLRKHICLFFSVNIPPKEGDKVGKAILSGANVENMEGHSLLDLCLALQKKIEITRERKDKKFEKNFKLIGLLPWRWVRHLLNLSSWLTYELNLNLEFLGIPKDPFGSVLITNVGSLGIDCAFTPLMAYTRVPMHMAVGAVRERPWVVDGQVVVRPIMSVGVTFDHRFMDGVHAAHMAKTFRQCFDEPDRLLLK